MNGAKYRALRESLNLTQQELADRLGLTRLTITRREGAMPITEEAAFAILWLVRGGVGGRKRVRVERRKAPNESSSAAALGRKGQP